MVVRSMSREEPQVRPDDEATGELSTEDLEAQAAVDLPEREAMSLIAPQPSFPVWGWDPPVEPGYDPEPPTM